MGSLQRSPDPLAGFEGPTSEGRRRKGGRRGAMKGWEGREGRSTCLPPHFNNPGYGPDYVNANSVQI